MWTHALGATPADFGRSHDEWRAERTAELTKPDAKVEVCSTTIDGVAANTVIVKVPNNKGDIIDREIRRRDRRAGRQGAV